MSDVLLIILGLLVLMFGIVIGAMIHGGFPANAGDWVNFSGAIIGSVVTVAGAIAAFEWQAGRDRKRRRGMLTDQLDYVIRLCAVIEDPIRETPEARMTLQVEAAEELRSALAKLRNSLAWTQPDTRAAIEAYEIIKDLKLGSYLDVDALESLASKNSDVRAGALAEARDVRAWAAAARSILEFDS